MTNHLQNTKEAYLEMMKSLLEERRDITKMYYEIKNKVDEIDKLLMAGDSGKVSNGQAAEIMAYANLFNNRPIVTEKAIKKGNSLEEKIKMTIPIEDITNEQIDKLREKFSPAPREKLNPPTAAEQLKEALNGFGKAAAQMKDLPKPRQATREELIASSVEPAKEGKPKAVKLTVRKGRGKGGALGNDAHPVVVKILKEQGRPTHVHKLCDLVAKHFDTEVEYHSFASALSKLRKKDSNIIKAGRGLYMYKG